LFDKLFEFNLEGFVGAENLALIQYICPPFQGVLFCYLYLFGMGFTHFLKIMSSLQDCKNNLIENKNPSRFNNIVDNLEGFCMEYLKKALLHQFKFKLFCFFAYRNGRFWSHIGTCIRHGFCGDLICINSFERIK